MAEPSLISAYTWHGESYLVKVCIVNTYLEVSVSSNQTAEQWQCCYDQAYIESLTHKTGNYKSFDTFCAMLKSGVLKTKESITLDLLTYEDLESLRVRRMKTETNFRNSKSTKSNRRYLILTYTVDFDRVNYPLSLEYCGPPDPLILQQTIKRLEAELGKARNELARKSTDNLNSFKERIEQLEAENYQLRLQLRQNSGSNNQRVETLQKAITQLEKSVSVERSSHHQLVEKLRSEKLQLSREVERLRDSELSLQSRLRLVERLGSVPKTREDMCKLSTKTLYRRSRSNSADKQRSISPSPTRIMQRIKVENLKLRIPNSSPSSASSIHSSASVCSNSDANYRSRPRKTSSKQRSRSNSQASSSGSITSRASSKGSLSKRVINPSAPVPTSHKARKASSLQQYNKNEFLLLERKVSALQKLLNVKR